MVLPRGGLKRADGPVYWRNALAMGALATGAPWFGWQAWRLWRDTPRLPEAGGPCHGLVPAPGKPLHLVLLGESTAAGVGAATHHEALAGCLARALHRRWDRPVMWNVAGRNGARARDMIMAYRPQLESATAQFVCIALGVNDLLSAATPSRWARDLAALVDDVHRTWPDARVLVSAVPPIGRFPQIRRPLRDVLGWRAQDFDAAARRVCRARSFAVFAALPFGGGEAYFCADRFHPSPRGYAAWADELAIAVS